MKRSNPNFVCKIISCPCYLATRFNKISIIYSLQPMGKMKHLKGFGPQSISRIVLPKKRSNLPGEASQTNTEFKNEPMRKLLDRHSECCQLLHSKSPLPPSSIMWPKDDHLLAVHLSKDTHRDMRWEQKHTWMVTYSPIWLHSFSHMQKQHIRAYTTHTNIHINTHGQDGTDVTYFFMKQKKILTFLRTTASKNSRNHTFLTIVIQDSQKLLS